MTSSRSHAMHVHDTLSGATIPLPARKAGEASIYLCGPTVYGLIHVGNARPAIVYDVLVRHLRAGGTKVTFVRNFTDIDDKIIKVALRENVEPSVIAERYIAAYREDIRAINCVRPDHEPKVSEHLPEIVAMISTLIEKGHAYESKGDVYYRVRSFEGYGKLSKRDFSPAADATESHHRIGEDNHKEDQHDFALWKAAKPTEPAGARWSSPWSEGRPGWHIECSAMARKILGDGFDLHGGAIDLIFPHHENEIAQSEASSGVPFCSAWMHNGFINVHGEKASKSDNEQGKYAKEESHYFILRNLYGQIDPEAIRLWILGTHYRSPLEWEISKDKDAEKDADGMSPVRFPSIEEAERRVEYFYDTRARLAPRAEKAAGALTLKAGHPVLALRKTFDQALDDDLNTSVALGVVAELFRKANELCDGNKKDAVEIRGIYDAIEHVCSVLGIAEGDPADFALRVRTRRAAQRKIDAAEIDAMLLARVEARKNKDFAKADGIRAELTARGIEVRDEAGGAVWRIV